MVPRTRPLSTTALGARSLSCFQSSVSLHFEVFFVHSFVHPPYMGGVKHVPATPEATGSGAPYLADYAGPATSRHAIWQDDHQQLV
jgi:hypothetical protein